MSDISHGLLSSKFDGSTHACNIDQCGGGVGRNMAEALWRLRGGRTRLLTAVGDDADGQYLHSIAPGLILDGCIIKGGRTPSYAAMLDSRGECLLGLGDMALHNHITPDLVNKHIKVLEQTPLVVLDGNAPQATIDHVLAVCERLEKPVKRRPHRQPTDGAGEANDIVSPLFILGFTPPTNELRDVSDAGDLSEANEISVSLASLASLASLTSLARPPRHSINSRITSAARRLLYLFLNLR